MSPIEIVAIVFFSLLLIIVVSSVFRRNIPRHVSIQGIEDPKAAEAYDRISRMPQFKRIRSNFVKKLETYAINKSITDIGCGPGYLLQVIANELPEKTLVGVDISEEMVEIAKANVMSRGYADRIVFKLGSADHLPFGDGTQDFVISTLSLHHWNEPQAVFKEIYRVLKPDGQMLIYDLRRDAQWLFFYLIWFAQHVALRFMDVVAIREINEPMGSLLASYTKKEIEEMMRQTPFNDYAVQGKLGCIYLYGKKMSALKPNDLCGH